MVDDDDGTDGNPVAVVKRDRSGHRLLVHHRAVLAAEVLDARVSGGDENPRVAARDPGRVELNGRRRLPADDVLAVGERDAARSGDDPAADDGRRRDRPLQLARERVADAVRRTNDWRLLVAIVERAA